MTATTESIETPRRDGNLVAHGVAASTKVLEGTLVKLTSGYAESMTKAASLVFAGVAYEEIDNTSGSAGDKVVRVERTGIFEFAMSGAAITDIGSEVYALDNQTVTKTGTDATRVGKIVAFENAGKVFVDIGGEC